MILFILLCVLTVVSWIVGPIFYNRGKEIAATLFILLSVLGTVGTLVSIMYYATKNTDAITLQEDRVYYGEVVKNLSNEMPFDFVNKTITKAQRINEKILTNRENCDNKFYGIYYNKKIGENELIDIPELHIIFTLPEEE